MIAVLTLLIAAIGIGIPIVSGPGEPTPRLPYSVHTTARLKGYDGKPRGPRTTIRISNTGNGVADDVVIEIKTPMGRMSRTNVTGVTSDAIRMECEEQRVLIFVSYLNPGDTLEVELETLLGVPHRWIQVRGRGVSGERERSAGESAHGRDARLHA